MFLLMLSGIVLFAYPFRARRRAKTRAVEQETESA